MTVFDKAIGRYNREKIGFIILTKTQFNKILIQKVRSNRSVLLLNEPCHKKQKPELKCHET